MGALYRRNGNGISAKWQRNIDEMAMEYRRNGNGISAEQQWNIGEMVMSASQKADFVMESSLKKRVLGGLVVQEARMMKC